MTLKTDWKLDDTVMPQHLNEICEEVNSFNEKMENVATDAAGTFYDNSVSKLESDNVQDAIDEVNEKSKKALSKASANETSIQNAQNDIQNLQNELGNNKTVLEANINAIREVL